VWEWRWSSCFTIGGDQGGACHSRALRARGREEADRSRTYCCWGREGTGDPCDALAAIYESMYGKAPKHMTAASVLCACEKGLGLPGDFDCGRRGWRRWRCSMR